MSQSALIRSIEDILSDSCDPVAAIIAHEQKRGYRVIRPGDTPWFRANDWRAASVASVSGTQVRLVLLHGFESGKGAFTRMVREIVAAGYKPSVIDPTPEFAAALKRRRWHGKRRGSTFENIETIWRPRSC